MRKRKKKFSRSILNNLDLKFKLTMTRASKRDLTTWKKAERSDLRLKTKSERLKPLRIRNYRN